MICFLKFFSKKICTDSIGIEFEYMYTNVPWEPKMLVTHQLVSSLVVGVGSLIDGSQSTVWLLAIEGEFRRIMKKCSKKERIILNI